jgi:hypothetical protein
MTLARRKLEELWNTSEEFDFSPAKDGSFMVKVRKLGPAEQQLAAREASSARTTFTLMAKDPESAQNINMVNDLSEIPREDKVTQLAMSELADQREKIEQEISGFEEWKKDGKLQGLVDAWENGLLEEWLKGEGARSEESERVFAEMQRFTEEVETKLASELEIAKRRFDHFEDEEIDQKMIDAQVEYDSSAEWLRVFRMYQIMYGVREIEADDPIFESIDEIAGQAQHANHRGKILAGDPTFLGMVRIARTTNTSVFSGITDLREMPFDLMTAFQHASTILGWFENIPLEEQPPDWMWPFTDEVSQWFDEVKLARRQESGLDDGEGSLDEWSAMSNEFAEDRGK